VSSSRSRVWTATIEARRSGGTIPAEDIPELKALGVAQVFTPGAPTRAIVDVIVESVGQRDFV
jgi:methylmalonyl-CoA mutase cobalamin-binding domain/chain